MTRTAPGRTRRTLPPALERRALELVDELVDADDPATIAAMLADEPIEVDRRVRRLLDLTRATDDSLAGIASLHDLASLRVPERVGVFAPVEQIGEGGMGVVWRAERVDGLFEQVVAIKLLRASPDLFGARFAEERRILARLDHPNIARLIDGGVAEGLPYLVMEHAPGRHIDAAVADRPLAERIALFVEVARAVQFAHTRLVVHADLKPSNIVVGEDGRVKLLDFGVARLIDRDSDAPHPMTPAYASPARRAGRAPLIADDVFSLGRILGLLIGDARDADLAAIVAKAGAEDEARRYPAVGDLIADLDRWRDRLPVSARAPDWRYRTGRFVARHRIGVAATALVVLLLSLASVSTLLAARAAERERRVAERRFDDVRQLSRFMLADLYDELGNAPGTVRARVRIASVARRYLDRLAADGDSPAALRLEIAQGYERLARVQGVSGIASLGRPSDALASLDRADAQVARLLRERPDDPAVHTLAGEIALDRWTLAPDNADSTRLNARARGHFAKALHHIPPPLREERKRATRSAGEAQCRPAPNVDCPSPDLAFGSATLSPQSGERERSAALIGLLLTEKNRAVELVWTDDKPKSAIAVLERALARLDAARIDGGHHDEAQQLRVNLLNRLGDATYYAGDNAGSLAAFRRARAVIDAELARRETLAWLERRGESHWYVSGALEDDDPPAALREAETGVATMRRVLSYGPDSNAEKWLAILHNQQAALLAAQGRVREAAAATLASIAIRERRAAAQPGDFRRTRDLAVGLKTAAETLAKAGRGAEACRLARRSVGLWQAIARRGQLGKLDAKKAFPEARGAAAAVCR
jgi:hypothetical protein